MNCTRSRNVVLASSVACRFELLDVLTGMRSVTVHYRSVNDKVAAEVINRNADGLITRVEVHYRDGDKQTTEAEE